MKKILILLLLFFFTKGAFAIGNIYIDGVGAYTQTNDAKNQYGWGLGLLYKMSDDFNVFFKTIISQRKNVGLDTRESIPGEYTEYFSKYKYRMFIGGIEYLYNINNLPFYWKNSAAVGVGAAEIKSNYNYDFGWPPYGYRTDKKDTGICVAFWTGILYTFTQSLSGYIDVGYHKTYFNDELKDAKIMGLQVVAGVRFTAWGVNKSIYSEY